MGTIKSRIDNISNSVVNGKTLISESLVNNGIEASSTESFKSLSDKIGSIKGDNYIIPKDSDPVWTNIPYNQYYSHSGFKYNLTNKVRVDFGSINMDFINKFFSNNYSGDYFSLVLSSIYPNYESYSHFETSELLEISNNDEEDITSLRITIGGSGRRIEYNQLSYNNLYMVVYLDTYRKVIYLNDSPIYDHTPNPNNINSTYRDDYLVLPFVCPRYVYWEEDNIPSGCNGINPFPNLTIKYEE